MKFLSVVNKQFLILVLSGLLLACQQRASMQVYVLEAQTLPIRESQLEETVVVIRDIVFADYISQTQLMMQTSAHQLDLAKWHVWQGNLAAAFERALLNDLNQHRDLLFVSDELLRISSTKKNAIDLYLKVEKAFPSQDGFVYLSGYYWLENRQGDKFYSQFSYQAELAAAGYVNAVGQLRELVFKLAADLQAKTLGWLAPSEATSEKVGQAESGAVHNN